MEANGDKVEILDIQAVVQRWNMWTGVIGSAVKGEKDYTVTYKEKEGLSVTDVAEAVASVAAAERAAAAAIPLSQRKVSAPLIALLVLAAIVIPFLIVSALS
jgi:hypothetical protein